VLLVISGTDVPQNRALTPRFAVRLLVLFDAQGASCVPMTEYVAALQARGLPHWLSCATDEHL
jgi:hypothetical protein